MEKKYIPEWAVKGPLDFEYRHYKLLAEVNKLKAALKDGHFSDTLKKVDDTLDYLYRYDAERILASEDLSNFELTGINFNSFELEYVNNSLEQDQIMNSLCDEAIDMFEDLHSSIRDIWREVEAGINVNYVPHRKYFLNDGFVFIITADNKLHSYYFNKPSKYILDWRYFKLEYLSSCKYSKKSYIKHMENINAAETDKLVLKVECNNATRIEGFAIEVIKSIIYTMLKKDYPF